MKIDEIVKCPYCNHEEMLVFYINADTLICNNCNKEFAIKLEKVVITKILTDVLNTHECYGCDTKFHEGNLPQDKKCPNCKIELYEMRYHDSPVYYK